ncbi:hypothetical protein GCM10023187_03500 [Nibrella viscosa]|uniref:Uncharacterized protein n=1 Tax=Nibrella viscosa TaxID=1084524 RepID=A0ABP8JU01_9BACT
MIKRYIRPLLMVLFAVSLLFVQKVTLSGQAAYKHLIASLGLTNLNIAVMLPMLATACLLLLFVLPDGEPNSTEQIDNQS